MSDYFPLGTVVLASEVTHLVSYTGSTPSEEGTSEDEFPRMGFRQYQYLLKQQFAEQLINVQNRAKLLEGRMFVAEVSSKCPELLRY